MTRSKAQDVSSPESQDLWPQLAALFARHPTEVLSLKDIRDALDVGADDRRDLRGLLHAAEEDGRLERVRGRAWRMPAPVHRVEGRVHRHERGFGFLLDTGAPGGNDPFIPPEQMEGLLHGDLVRARIEPGRGGRTRAVVEKVMTARARVVGVTRRWGKRWLLELDGHQDGFLVTNPEAWPMMADGLAVEANITQRPEATHRGTAEVVGVLGQSGSLKVEVEKLVAAAGVPVAFLPAALAQVTAFSQDIAAEGLKDPNRKDITHIPLVTIDGEDAKDFDDAVHVEPHGQRVTLTVAIADVSHYVAPGTPLDADASQRGTSVYFPRRVIPMLPHALSDDLCSLRPHVPRLCMVAQMEFAQGACVPDKTHFFAGLMRSRARLTYTRVHEAASAGLTALPEAPGFDLGAALELYKRLRKGRLARGALDLELPETQVTLDEQGEPVGIREAPRWESHQLIEEFMIAANEAVARFFDERNLPCVYRIHEQPDEDRLQRFVELSGAYARGGHLKPNPSPQQLQQFMGQLAGHPALHVLQFQLLRAMMQARYAAHNAGHYGLASTAYLHFTSPIRRYPDLLVHRLLRQALAHPRRHGREETNAPAVEALTKLAETSSRAERRSTDLERQVDSLYAAAWCQRHLGEAFEGEITGMGEPGMFVRIHALGADGLLPVEALGHTFATVDDRRGMLLGSKGQIFHRLGDKLKVRLADVNLSRRQVLLALEDPPRVVHPASGRDRGHAGRGPAGQSGPPKRGGGGPSRGGGGGGARRGGGGGTPRGGGGGTARGGSGARTGGGPSRGGGGGGPPRGAGGGGPRGGGGGRGGKPGKRR